jgi:hypothetical protein
MTATLSPPRIEVREAVLSDGPTIMRLRGLHEREFVGKVDVPVNVVWFVAECMGEVCACAGVCMSTADGHERTAIVTDFYDDGTRQGKRALLGLLDDALSSNCRIYAIIPTDRPGLARALERRGLRVSGIQMESPR